MHTTIPVKNAYKYGSILNIEGGLPAQNLIKNTTQHKLWSNAIIVLDRPLVDNIIFDDLLKKVSENNYPLLENSIDNLNEHNFIAFFVALIGYYINNGKSLTNLASSDTLNITVHVHQDVTCMPLVKILETYIQKIIVDLKIDISKIVIEFRTDKHTYIESTHDYTNTNILISLSQCAGLDPEFNPGEIILPIAFVPYDIDTKTIRISDTYTVDNDLIKRSSQIIDSKYMTWAQDYINSTYVSSNSKKSADKVKSDLLQIKYSKVLHVDKLWNPIDGDELVELQ